MNDPCLGMNGLLIFIQIGLFISYKWMRAAHEAAVLFKEHKQAHPFRSESEMAGHVDMHPCAHAPMALMRTFAKWMISV